MIRATLTLHIERPVDEVVAYVSDIENLPQWADVIRSAKLVNRDSDGTGATFDVEMQFMGTRASARYRVAADPDGRGVTVSTLSGPVRLVNRYRFDAAEGGTRMSVTSEGHASGLSGLLEPVIRRLVRHQFESDHARLKRLLEA